MTAQSALGWVAPLLTIAVVGAVWAFTELAPRLGWRPRRDMIPAALAGIIVLCLLSTLALAAGGPSHPSWLDVAGLLMGLAMLGLVAAVLFLLGFS